MQTLLRTCAHPGCATITMGELCIRHETPLPGPFPRGRPFPARVDLLTALRLSERATEPALSPAEPVLAATGPAA